MLPSWPEVMFLLWFESFVDGLGLSPPIGRSRHCRGPNNCSTGVVEFEGACEWSLVV